MKSRQLAQKLKAWICPILHRLPGGYLFLTRRAEKLRWILHPAYEANRRLREERTPLQVQRIRERVAAGKPVRVAFVLYTQQMFALRALFEAMCRDTAFAPRIVVAPLAGTLSETNRFLEETYGSLHAEYGDKVMPIGTYDTEHDSYPDISGDYDLCVISCPYDDSMHENFRSEHLSKNCLCVYTNYGYSATAIMALHSYWDPNRALFWRVFAHNKHELEIIQDTNTLLCGSCVNDMFATHTRHESKRKRIILALHHSLPGWSTATLQLATFLTFQRVFLQLPKLYPQVDFIFRPHPLLFTKLKSDMFWGERRTQAWLDEFLGNPNVIYDKSGDYTAVMVDSDALIHDCCSFMSDYYYTGKPQCYLMRKHVDYRCFLTGFGMQILNHTYHAGSKKQICHFIDKVVLQGEDPMREERQAFADAEVKIGYPNVHKAILRHLKEQFGIQ